MSLLSGMTNMLQDDAVMEMAQDDYLFELELAMEAEEFVDAIVDGKPFAENDELDRLIDEDEVEDEINDQLDDLDNPMYHCAQEGFTVQDFEFDDCDPVYESYDIFDYDEYDIEDDTYAEEAAALTGDAFLRSLALDTDDPIKTHHGSVGYEDGAANFPTNYSLGEFDDDDPIETDYGSIGQQDSTANFRENYSDEKDNADDPIKTHYGSYGLKSASANPAVESAMFFGELLGDGVAMEGRILDHLAKVQQKREEKEDTFYKALGVNPKVVYKIEDSINDNEWSKVHQMIQSLIRNLEKGRDRLDTTTSEGKKLYKKANYKIKSWTALLTSTKVDAEVDKLVKKGMDPKEARKKVKKDIRQQSRGTVVEAYINECLDMIDAFEAANYAGYEKDTDDPITTKNGSIGQQDSAANFNGNFSGGELDDDDPIHAGYGSIGQRNSAATHEKNFTDEFDDDNDPIHTEYGGAGQKSSRANPAVEGDLESELDFMNEYLYDSLEETDDDAF